MTFRFFLRILRLISNTFSNGCGRTRLLLKLRQVSSMLPRSILGYIIAQGQLCMDPAKGMAVRVA